MPVKNIVEKPKMENAPSDMGVVGRYILNASIFDILENTKKVLEKKFNSLTLLQVKSQKKRYMLMSLKVKGSTAEINLAFSRLPLNMDFTMENLLRI